MENIKDRFCIGIGYRGTYDLEDAFLNMAKAGFTKTFLAINDELQFIGATFRPLAKFTESFGLELVNLHVPAITPNVLWEKGRQRDILLNKSLAYIDCAAEAGIHSLVFHVSDRDLKEYTLEGVDAFNRICEEANEYKTDICIENVEDYKVLDFLFENISQPSLKFCHDVGHNNVYTPEINLAERYGKYLGFTHIHDNDGISDLHEFPFTGTVDFKKVRDSYSKAGYTGILCLETTPQLAQKKYNGFENFFKIAYESLEKIFCD